MKTHPASGSGIEGKSRFARLLAHFGILTLAILGQSKAFAQVGPPAAGIRPDRIVVTLSLLNSEVNGGPLLGSEPFRFRVSGTPANSYVVEASSDLTQWTPAYTNFIPRAGSFDFMDSETGRFPQRFYRAVAMSDIGPLGGLLEGFRDDRILVKPKPGVILSVLGELHALLGTEVLQSYPSIGDLQVLQVPVAASVSDLIAIYQRSGLVEYAEPDYQVQALLAPNDFRYNDGSLWGLHNTGAFGGTPGADISAQDAWDIQNTANNIIVAVIDTGVRATHEDLAANLWVNPGEIPGNGIDDDGNGYVDDVHGINALNNTGDPNDDHGHGTHVSGTIGAAGGNSVGVVGVCWNVQLMECKFLDSTGNGFISDAIKCMDYARSKGAKVVNASWGSPSFTSTALHDAIDSLRQAGIIFVAAAGNSAGNNDVSPLYPASYELDNIISVAATTRTDELAFFSNYGATAVDLGAPGAAIFSCWNGSDSDYRYNDGTSMAAPHVAGACALLMAHFPNDNYQQIMNRILSNVDPLPSLAGKCRAGGRLNLQKALSGGSPAPQKPTVSVVATDANASEQGPDTGTFTITRAGDMSSALTVNYTLSGTAQNGTDYQRVGTSVTIAAGASSATVTVTPVDDTQVEGDETVILTIVSDAAYNVGSLNNATVTIHDNDQPPPQKPTVTVVATDANASEQGPDTGTFTITRAGDMSSALTVNYTLSGTAQNGTDYQRVGTSVTIAAGASSATVTVTPVDDTQVEGDETVLLTVASDAAYNVGSPSSATVTITDDDQPPPVKPTVSVVATDANASEQGSDPGTFTFTRTGNTGTALTVNFMLGGTATKWDDYRRPEGDMPESVTILAGASSTILTVVAVDDNEVEGDETIVLTIATDPAYDVGSPATATVTIADNDQPPPEKPTVTVAATDANAAEQGTDPGTFTASRTGSTAAALTVHYSLSGSAANGIDYQSLPTSVTIPAGAASANITVRPIDDTQVEGNETVLLTLTADAAYNVGSPDSATVTITDNDQPPPPAANFTANPTSGQAPLTVRFTDQSTGTISVWDWDFGDGSAHSSAQNPSHTFSSVGNFIVTLTVTGSGGTTSSSLTISVTAPPPALSADFTASQLLGIVPLVVTFTDRSTGNPVSWDWNFGDGSQHSSAQNPTHIYIVPGTYTVTLTVRNSAGATSSKSATIRATLL